MSLYNFIQQFRFADAPPSTQRRVQTCLVDILGVAAGAMGTLSSQSLRHYAVEHYPSKTLCSRLLFSGDVVHPLGAAWAGGFCIDSLDAHEGHFTSKGHAGATVVPALLALMDATREQGRSISGEECLTILALGYETALRAGVALMASASDYHASGAFSGIGVVCAGARLLGLDESTFRHALGIAEYFGPRCPMMRLIDYPSMLRDAHGAGAHAGVNALLLAQSGVTGAPATIVESPTLASHWRSLGENWEIDEQYFKPWPVCRWAQPALTAVTRLMDKAPECRPDNIQSIRVETFHESMRLQGHTPANVDEAQYALAFPLAALIARGQLGPMELCEGALGAPDILAISQLIEIVEAADLSARFPEEILSRVTIELDDGRRLESPTTAALGDPESPLSDAEMLKKFHYLASATLGEEHRRAIVLAVEFLPTAKSCEDFFDLILARTDSKVALTG